MKLRNKKTGEIRNAEDVIIENLRKNGSTLNAISIDEIRNEWEDYEEPKEFWYIAHNGIVGCFEYDDDWQYMDFNWQDKLKQIGNYFETKEEAEKAVRKLKALKRLKDLGFKFKDWKTDVSSKNAGVVETTFNLWADLDPETVADLDLLFNQEDD